MTDWTKVVTQPLGLAGFALFLVFGYLAKVKRSDERRWLSPATIALAVIALLGGLFLSYRQIPNPQSQPVQAMQMQSPASQQTNSDVQQTSTGEGSPNVQGVDGDVRWHLLGAMEALYGWLLFGLSTGRDLPPTARRLAAAPA